VRTPEVHSRVGLRGNRFSAGAVNNTKPLSSPAALLMSIPRHPDTGVFPATRWIVLSWTSVTLSFPLLLQHRRALALGVLAVHPSGAVGEQVVRVDEQLRLRLVRPLSAPAPTWI
jgi:hypothetical protein